MNNLKAILGGFFAIILMGLIAQLAFIFIGVGYFKLVKMYPSLSFLSETTTVLLFLSAAVIAFAGGVLTAKLSPSSIIRNCLIVGLLADALSLVPSLQGGYEITVNGVIFLLVLVFSTLAGGLYMSKKQEIV